MKRLLNQKTFCCLPVFASKKRLANWVFFFLFLGFSSFSFASPAAFSRSLTGKVTNADGSPLSGVTVTLKGTAVAVSTDNAGEFTIEVPDEKEGESNVIDLMDALKQSLGRKKPAKAKGRKRTSARSGRKRKAA